MITIGYIIVGLITIIMALGSWIIVSKADKNINDDDKEVK